MIPAILLAAGASSRHKEHKLLAPFQEHTLIEHTVKVFRNAQVNPILVVVGSEGNRVENQIEKYDVDIVYNAEWSQGMGKSIAKGLEACLSKYPQSEAAIISVCDQAYLNTETIQNLVDANKLNPNRIIISRYAEGNGPPSLFPKSYFADLLALSDDSGAKSIVKANLNKVETIQFEKGYIDLDTSEDFDNYNQNS